MKKTALLAFVLVVSSLALISKLPTPVEAHPANITVPDNYERIQWAIGNASDGDTIFVRAGTYYERVVVDKLISLIGENRSTTVIDGNGTGDVINIDEIIYVTANHINVTGFTIRNGTNGIFIKYSDYNTISGNIVTDNQNGIHLFSTCSCNFARNNTVRNNIIKNNGVGISLGVAQNNVIYHNNFINNTQQVLFTKTPSYANFWDDNYPSGGNYWSDYEERYPDAEELDDSGIWNTTYVIDEKNLDRYPFMSVWGDVEPPVADAGSNQSVFQGMTVTLDASGSTDDVAIKSYVWTFTDSTPKTLTGIKPQYIFKNAGDFEVTLNVTDYAGKWNIDTMWVHVMLEANPPTTTDDYDDLWHTMDFTITLNATDDFSGVAETYYKINDGPTLNVSAHGQPLITTESANNTLEYWSADINDNEEIPHHILTDIKLDKTSPTISITSPSDGAEVRSSPMIVWNGADATSGIDRYEIRLDDGSWINVGTNTTYTFTGVDDGSHTVDVKAFDEAGNSQVFSVNFTMNTSLIGGPAIIGVIVVIVALATAICLLKIRKKT